eukprot:1883844-Rhodomonas_salina.3
MLTTLRPATATDGFVTVLVTMEALGTPAYPALFALRGVTVNSNDAPRDRPVALNSGGWSEASTSDSVEEADPTSDWTTLYAVTRCAGSTSQRRRTEVAVTPATVRLATLKEGCATAVVCTLFDTAPLLSNPARFPAKIRKVYVVNAMSPVIVACVCSPSSVTNTKVPLSSCRSTLKRSASGTAAHERSNDCSLSSGGSERVTVALGALGAESG